MEAEAPWSNDSDLETMLNDTLTELELLCDVSTECPPTLQKKNREAYSLTNINVLPRKVLAHIFSFLDKETRVHSVPRVCLRWYHISIAFRDQLSNQNNARTPDVLPKYINFLNALQDPQDENGYGRTEAALITTQPRRQQILVFPNIDDGGGSYGARLRQWFLIVAMICWTGITVYALWHESHAPPASEHTVAPALVHDFAASSIEYVRRRKNDLSDL